MTDIADDYTTWDAPYVLGALTRIERTEYEDHLAGCPDCRAAVAELAGLPGMLALVESETALAMIEPRELEPPGTAPAEPPLPALLPRLAAAAERQRRRRRWTTLGIVAAAAAVAIAAPVVVSVTDAPDSPGTGQIFAERAMRPVEPSPVTASVKLVRAEGKTRVVMSCDYGPGEQPYRWNLALVVIRTDGQQEVLGQWPAGPGTELTIDRAVDTGPEQIRTIEIRTVDRARVLLTADI